MTSRHSRLHPTSLFITVECENIPTFEFYCVLYTGSEGVMGSSYWCNTVLWIFIHLCWLKHFIWATWLNIKSKFLKIRHDWCSISARGKIFHLKIIPRPALRHTHPLGTAAVSLWVKWPEREAGHSARCHTAVYSVLRVEAKLHPCCVHAITRSTCVPSIFEEHSNRPTQQVEYLGSFSVCSGLKQYLTKACFVDWLIVNVITSLPTWIKCYPPFIFHQSTIDLQIRHRSLCSRCRKLSPSIGSEWHLVNVFCLTSLWDGRCSFVFKFAIIMSFSLLSCLPFFLLHLLLFLRFICSHFPSFLLLHPRYPVASEMQPVSGEPVGVFARRHSSRTHWLKKKSLCKTWITEYAMS
jgi:hypothetical protein